MALVEKFTTQLTNPNSIPNPNLNINPNPNLNPTLTLSSPPSPPNSNPNPNPKIVGWWTSPPEPGSVRDILMLNAILQQVKLCQSWE